jgi:hypothetical protein
MDERFVGHCWINASVKVRESGMQRLLIGRAVAYWCICPPDESV